MSRLRRGGRDRPARRRRAGSGRATPVSGRRRRGSLRAVCRGRRGAGGAPRARTGGCVGRSRPRRPAVGRAARRTPVRRAASRSAPPTTSPRACTSVRQRVRGRVGHRQHKQGVRRRAGRAHREARDATARVADDGPPQRPVDGRRDPGRPLVTVSTGRGAHDCRGDRVGREVGTGHGEEGRGVIEELDVVRREAAVFGRHREEGRATVRPLTTGLPNRRASMSAARPQRLVEGGPRNHTGAVPRALLVGTVGVVVVAALVVLLPWVLQRRLIYLPSTVPVPPAGQVLPGVAGRRPPHVRRAGAGRVVRAAALRGPGS